MKNIAVIICAAGAGLRFGGKTKKPFTPIAGRAAFLRSIDFFEKHPDVKQIILCISPDDDEMVKLKWGPNLSFYGVKICLGAKERFETVANAIEMVKEEVDLIAVHDSVRCCLQDKWIDDVFALAGQTGAAILASPVVATIKNAANQQIIETVDRTGLYEAQTPQVFDADLLKKAYQNINDLPDEKKAKISDDSALVESSGQKVSIVETDSSNIKITAPNDVAIATAIIKSRPKPKPEGYVGPYSEAQW